MQFELSHVFPQSTIASRKRRYGHDWGTSISKHVISISMLSHVGHWFDGLHIFSPRSWFYYQTSAINSKVEKIRCDRNDNGTLFSPDNVTTIGKVTPSQVRTRLLSPSSITRLRNVHNRQAVAILLFSSGAVSMPNFPHSHTFPKSQNLDF